MPNTCKSSGKALTDYLIENFFIMHSPARESKDRIMCESTRAADG